MKVPSSLWSWALLAAAIFIAARYLSSSGPAVQKSEPSRVPLDGNFVSPARSEQPSLATRTAGKMIEADLKELLLWLITEPKPSQDEIHARLLATRSTWSEMDPNLLAQTIGRLLESGRDGATGMKFKVGPHGLLDGWPSLRVFLLDALAAADPETSAAVAKELLDHTTSPDEYAVALRALTREGPGEAGEGELLDRFRFLLGKQEWQASGGFAETLDLARTIGTTDAAGQLLRWDGNPALKSMALHEFAAEHPVEMLESLRSEATVDPVLRAHLMARLEPENPDQLAAINQYLHDPERTPEDASVFLKSFPLRSATTGHRLYAASPAPYQLEKIAAGDRAALTLVNEWIASPPLPGIQPELSALQNRLTQWVEQTQ